MKQRMCCDDCRGNCEDNWIEVPLLHSTMEFVWLPAGCSIHPRHLDGGHHDGLSSISHSPQGCTRLPYWTHPTSHKGKLYIKTCVTFFHCSGENTDVLCIVGVGTTVFTINRTVCDTTVNRNINSSCYLGQALFCGIQSQRFTLCGGFVCQQHY